MPKHVFAVLPFFLGFLGVAALTAQAEPCFKCELHGPCPFPRYDDLQKCLGTNDTLKDAEKPVAPEPNSWIKTPCGQIRASHPQQSDK